MQYLLFFKYLAVMAIVTYLIRMVPYVAFRKKITNRFVSSFLYYIPYAVLGAMTVPAIFYSTNSFVTAACGCLVAIILSWFERGLLTVAVCASAVAFIFGLIF